ncbi:hypothetical protein HJG60_009444 [Phyllostomus discolor]|uniref:Kinetochore protein Nuf2 n=1 Tax=Phyllostomus discolor TaxID=89673 RepID=A0A833YLB5_9CHIR|nr:hypothetical protein HJG60_009444 [Phyllostomus discolor]
MQQLNTAHQEALARLEKLDSVPAEEQAEFQQLSEEIQELQQLLNQDFRQKTTLLQERNAQKKAELSGKAKHLNELKLSVVSLKEVQEGLKTKVVDSPEKLKNYKEKMKDTVQKLKNSRLEVMEKYELYRDSVDGLPSCQLEVQLYQKKIQDLPGAARSARGTCSPVPQHSGSPVGRFLGARRPDRGLGSGGGGGTRSRDPSMAAQQQQGGRRAGSEG